MDFSDDSLEVEDTPRIRRPFFRASYRDAFCLWCFLLFWEAMTAPGISHSPLHSWSECLTAVGICYGAVIMGRDHADPPAAFLFGMGCTFVFLPRYVFSGPIQRQYRYLPPNVPLTIAIWVGVALGLGFACWLIAKFVTRRPSVDVINSNSRAEETAGDEMPKMPKAAAHKAADGIGGHSSAS